MGRDMTQLLEEAVAAVRRMPERDQDEFARALIQMTQTLELGDIEPEHRDAVCEGLRQAERSEFASEAEVREVLGRSVR